MLSEYDIERIANAVARKIGRPNGEYSGVDLPPDVKTRQRFNVLVKGCKGAEMRGKVWFVPIDSWNDMRRAMRGPEVKLTPEQEAEQDLINAGYRRIR